MPRNTFSTMIRSALRHHAAAPAAVACAPGRRDRACGSPPFALVPLLAALAAAPVFAAPHFEVAETPLFTISTINPNVLIMLDTSQSMDATMAGKVISGLDPGTRSNVARSVLLEVLASQRYSFNWGLGSFDVRPSGRKQPVPTFAYYLGTSSTMVYTNVCNGIIDGVGVSDKTGLRAVIRNGVKVDEFGALPCIENPDKKADGTPGNGFRYVTFSRSGDDADVNDVFYAPLDNLFFYGVGLSGTDYAQLATQSTGPNGWTKADGTGGWLNDSTVVCLEESNPPCGYVTVRATDAGWLPQASEYPRQIWVRRARGFDQVIRGWGKINEPVVNSQVQTSEQVTAESTHFDRLKALLAAEEMTDSAASINLKNAAQRTPLAGTLQTSRDYFSRVTLPDGSIYPPPIGGNVCQRNYVVLATDGNPTGRKDGSAYSLSETANTRDANTGSYSFGAAARDVFAEIDALRATSFDGKVYDVQTFVVGLGDTVANPGSIAALNEMARRGGTGAAFLASSGDALKDSMRSIVTGIGSGEGAGSSVALSSRSFSAGSLLYQAKFSPQGWTGDLLALPIGADGLPGSTPVWQASTKLIDQNWDKGRQILTYKPSLSKGIAFRWPTLVSTLTTNDLDQSQVAALNTSMSGTPDDGFGSQRIAYLRGDTSNEARNKTTEPIFRNRLTNDPERGKVANVLGDIVDSAPLYVAGPSAGYPEGMESASYPAFAATWASRPPVVYVGANDGMLHAFDAQTGVERFAYVPGRVYTSENSTVSPLVHLTSRSYTHKYTVNGSLSVGDVFHDGAWRSLLVSGLRYGGRGVFALDVTNPAAVTEQNAAAVVRWEFTDDGMGYVYGKPLIVKTNDGRWSVIFGNGVPSKTGSKSRLYILDAANGSLKRAITTNVGSSTEPNGLSGVTAVDIDNNGTVDLVYGGDVQGYLWKFDLSSKDPSTWNNAVGGDATKSPLFVTGDKRPITGAPDVTRHPNGGFMIVFGTGRYLAREDVSEPAKQTIYGIWNKSDALVKDTMLQPQQILGMTTTAPNGDVYRFSTHRVGTPSDNALAEDGQDAITRNAYFAEKLGWYIDLPTTGERVVSDAAIRGGRAVFSSIIPSTDPCLPGGTGWVIEVDALTGNRRATATFDTNNDLLTTNADFLKVSTGAAATNNTSGWRIDSLASQAAAMSFRSESSNFERRFVQGSKATLRTKVGPGRPGERQRVQWRVVE